MKKIITTFKRKNSACSIHIGSGILPLLKSDKTVQSASSIVIITDSNVARHWLEPIIKVLSGKKIITICINPGEMFKTIDTLKIIWKKILEGRVDRSSVVITLGGGVMCDIGGFAAGTYMRGIPVVHIPTTLLAQIDASVGGKTAIDFCDIKNSIGVFHQPSTVIIDIQMLQTLPHRQIVSGFAEIVKHAVIADQSLFDFLLKKKVDEISNEEWIEIIRRSINVKKRIVEQDETEKNGVRKQLNFGHTVGHAIESLSLKTLNPLLHGEAVAIGMVAETRMSRHAGLISQEDEEVIISAITQWGLPTDISVISASQIQRIIRTDKKNKEGIILWSLPMDIGKVKSDIFLSPEIIKKGILSIIK